MSEIFVSVTYLLTCLLTKDPHGQTGTDVAQAHCVRPHILRVGYKHCRLEHS